MVRSSYVHEMRSALTYPLAAALAEGSFTGVVAVKYFDASPVLLAVITAAPMFGNVMALVWAELARTRRKVPFVNLLQAGVVASIAAVALTRPLPREVGGWVFALLIVLARVLASGIVTVRSAIWRYNYPRHTRGQIIGRITMTATFVLAVTTFAGSVWLDRDPAAYAYLYPLAALVGILGIYQFSRVRVRLEGQTLRRELQQVYTPRPEDLAQTDETNVLNYQPREHKGVRRFLAESMTILREDPTFRRYQWWQFLNGAAFMVMVPPLVFLVGREMTDPKTEYVRAILVLQIVPMATSILCTQLWAPLFDRLHIFTFRVYQSVFSVTAHAVLLIGALQGELWVIALGQFVVGVSNAAGNLAWNLGHNDFAPPEKSAAYMGVHVMLTGLRGCVAPFAGVWLFSALGIDRWVFALSGAMCFIATLGFISMARGAPRKMPPARVKQMTEATRV